jgi:ankyrin repeat protein
MSEVAFIHACLAGNSSQLRRWGRQGVRARTAEPLLHAVCDGASFEVLSCSVNELGADVNEVGEKKFSALGMAASLGHDDTVRYLVEELGADVNSPDKLG